MKRVSLLTLIAVLWGTGLIWAAQEPAASNPSPPEQLMKRVQEHYTFIQTGDWAKAEAYLTEGSKEYFRGLSRKSPLGFRIGKVQMAADGHAADITVIQKVMPEGMPAALDIPHTSVWKLVNGDWYRELTPPPAGASTPAVPFGTNPTPPPPTYLKFAGKRFGFGRFEQGTKKVARFPFTNISDKTIRITDVDTRCDCLTVEGLKEEYKPGDSGEVAIVFDSSRFLRDYDQTVFVHAEPDHQTYYLRVYGYIHEKGYFEKVPNDQKKPKP